MVYQWLKKTGIKKRYIALGVIALELVSLPAAAKLIGQISFSETPNVSAVLIDSIAGRTRFAVASNAPFYISADNAVGEISIKIHKSGQIRKARFGDKAQMPGAAVVCSSLTGSQRLVVYQSDHQTALKDGEILDQAVIVALHYDETSSPNFKIEVGNPTYPFAKLTNCDAKLA
jgi:hypothetical protein